MSGNDSRAAIAKETGLAEAALARLGVGQFYVKVGNRPAFRLDMPTFGLPPRFCRVHLIFSLLKRWISWHRPASRDSNTSTGCLQEFTLRFNRRRAGRTGSRRCPSDVNVERLA